MMCINVAVIKIKPMTAPPQARGKRLKQSPRAVRDLIAPCNYSADPVVDWASYNNFIFVLGRNPVRQGPLPCGVIRIAHVSTDEENVLEFLKNNPKTFF